MKFVLAVLALACVALATTPVFMNTDNIISKSQDLKMMKDIASALEQHNYKCEIGSIGPNGHYTEVVNVKKNGIYMTIFGGACAGTLWEMWNSSWYYNHLKPKNAKMVIAFLTPPSCNIHCLYWLRRAHDDHFSPKWFKGCHYPEKELLEHGFGVVYGKNALEIAKNFPGFAAHDNCTKYRPDCHSPL